jgi:hypothetical protein
MNRYLANYLFSNETLFVVSKNYSEAVDQGIVQKIQDSTTVISNESRPVEAIDISAQNEAILELKKTDSLEDVVVIVNSINSIQKDLLLKIISSVKLSFEHISLIDVSSNTLSFSELIKKSKHPKLRIISFGVEMSEIGLEISVSNYQLKVEKNLSFLLIDSLQAIYENKKDEKRLLWVVLKQMFLP